MNKVPKAFLLMGGVLICMNIIGQLMMFEKKETIKKFVSLEELEVSAELSDEFANSPGVVVEESLSLITFKQALRMPDLYVIALAFSFFKIGPTVFGVNYKTYGQEFINDDKFLNDIASVISILNIFTRFFWGWVIDRLSFKVKK